MPYKCADFIVNGTQAAENELCPHQVSSEKELLQTFSQDIDLVS